MFIKIVGMHRPTVQSERVYTQLNNIIREGQECKSGLSQTKSKGRVFFLGGAAGAFCPRSEGSCPR